MHLRRWEKAFGKRHKELERAPPLPRQFEWLQAAFFRLHRRRSRSESGPQPLTFTEIATFGERVLNIHDDELMQVYVRIMEEVDSEALAVTYEQQNRAAEKAKAESDQKSKRKPKAKKPR